MSIRKKRKFCHHQIGKHLHLLKLRRRRLKESPYLETELWERDDLLFITKYEPFKRNKAALTFTYYSNIDIRYCY